MNRALISALLGITLAACGVSVPPSSTGITAGVEPTTRYAFANGCYAVRDNATQKYLTLSGGQYAASAGGTDAAEAFRMKPSALGKYLVYGSDRMLLAAGATANSTAQLALASASPGAEWTVTGVGDTTQYPDTPVADVNPDAAKLAAYRAFTDPNLQFIAFTMRAGSTTLAPVSFQPLPAARCAQFPEAADNVRGETYKGTVNGKILGFADSHLHPTSTSFLGGAKPGAPFHKYGVTYALASCEAEHGPDGSRDTVGALFTGDTNGHATDGFPTFTDWPARGMTTHEATYWTWIQRAWKAGLRVMLDYAVDNETLCELERNAANDPTRECNEMINAGRQLATAHAMMDYIDAQYGGRGAGWYRIVTTPAQARAVAADGKMAILLGVEVSNLFNCKLTFNPANTQDAFEETGGGGATGQTYGCAVTETGAPNEILTQINRLKQLGVVALYTVHEFDNALGGSDIFEGTVLNLGTKENSGGDGPNNVATGEYWSTFDCPAVDDPSSGGGFVFPFIGVPLTNDGPPPPACTFQGRGGRHGGKTACYPQAVPQCNGRGLTPLGAYAWSKVMESGFIFEIDHLGYFLKDQLLALSEAQSPNYPISSGHGFAGLSWRQAQRVYAGGGIVYPSLNSTEDFTHLWKTLKPLWRAAGSPGSFGFGFGSDTNGLSPQMAPRASIAPGKEVKYPFTLFEGPGFDGLGEFSGIAPVVFDQPEARDPDGKGRTWSEDVDGNAHYGMAADFVEELRIEGSPEQMHDLYNSAEAYLQFWERTQVAAAAVRQKGIAVPANLLTAAPK